MKQSRSIAWVTVLAMLFSAVSPALAATLFSDKPAILAQILGIPAASVKAAQDEDSAHDEDHHAASHDNGSKSTHDGPPHQTHGIYCSFCLNASSTITISAALPAFSFLTLAFHITQTERQHSYLAAFLPVYRSRAPPSIS